MRVIIKYIYLFIKLNIANDESDLSLLS